MDTASDFNCSSLEHDLYLQLGLHTPSTSSLGRFSPNPWSLELTPYLFGRDSLPEGDLNPSETDFHDSPPLNAPRNYTNSDEVTDRTADVFPGYGRKRALSSPAIVSMAGYNWVTSSDGLPMGLGILEESSSPLPKRPRLMLSSEGSFSALGNLSNFTDPDSFESTQSPISSASFTPKDMSAKEDDRVGDLSYRRLPHIPYPPTPYFPTSSHLNSNVVGSLSDPTFDLFGLPDVPAQNAAVKSVSPLMLQLALQRERLLVSGQTCIQPEPIPFSIPSATPSKKVKKEVISKPKKQKVTKGKKASKVTDEVVSEVVDEADDAARRREFLERNRVAACKSRLKKKERVGNLEQEAAEICAQNLLLQEEAFEYQKQLNVLRELVDRHNGCSCEHVVGYLAREVNGGGIPTIVGLAGRVLKLDYKKVPSMGADEDLYQFEEDVPKNVRDGSEALSASSHSKKPRKGKEVKAKSSPIKEEESASVPVRPTLGRSRKSSSGASSSFELAILASPDFPQLALPTPRHEDIAFESPLHLRTRAGTLLRLPRVDSDEPVELVAIPASPTPSRHATPKLEKKSSYLRDSYFPSSVSVT